MPTATSPSRRQRRPTRSPLDRHRDRHQVRHPHVSPRSPAEPAGDRPGRLRPSSTSRSAAARSPLRHLGLAGEHSAALGQDRQQRARYRRHRHLEPVLPGQLERHRHADRLEERRRQLHLRRQRPDGPADRHPDAHQRDRERHLRSATCSSSTAPAASPSSPIPNGTAQVNLLQQNGFPAGELQQVAVSDKGRVVGTYSNGRTLDLAEITLANFNGANYLKRIDGGAFEVDRRVGPADLRRARQDRRLLARRLQHRHRRRVHQADRHPAGLFGQHPGHHAPATRWFRTS